MTWTQAFNTFIDDAFALMVSMPLHHRVACLRDDVVFAAFLVQLYLYPVDKTRANEYGIAYERGDEPATNCDSPSGSSPSNSSSPSAETLAEAEAEPASKPSSEPRVLRARPRT